MGMDQYINIETGYFRNYRALHDAIRELHRLHHATFAVKDDVATLGNEYVFVDKDMDYFKRFGHALKEADPEQYKSFKAVLKKIKKALKKDKTVTYYASW